MTRFHFERPDGIQGDPQNILIHLNEFVPPQGFETGAVIPPFTGDLIKVSIPAIGDIDYTNYKFYQVNKGELVGEQVDFIWEISDTLGPGKLLQASGFDIRPYLGLGRDLADSSVSISRDSFAPGIGNINIFQLSPDRLHLFGWRLTGSIIHEWVLSAPSVLPIDGVPSDFTFDVSAFEINGRDITFLDNSNKFMITGADSEKVHLFSFTTKSSLATTPIKIGELDLSIIGLTTTPVGVDFSPDGTKFILIGGNEDRVWQWLNLTPYTLPGNNTARDKTFGLVSTTDSLGNCRYSHDGNFIYISSRDTPDRISKFTTDGDFLIPQGEPTLPIQTSPDLSGTIDNDLRGMTLLENESEICISGRGTNTVHMLFIPAFLLEYEVTLVNVSTGAFTIRVKIPILKDFDFIQIAVGNASATDNSTTLSAGTTLSTHTTPLLTKDEDNILIDDQGRQIEAVNN